MPQPKKMLKPVKASVLLGGGARRWSDTLAARAVVVMIFLGAVVLGAISPEYLSILQSIICPGGFLTRMP